MCVNHIPSPIENARTKVESIYTGPLNTSLVQDMFACDPNVRDELKMSNYHDISLIGQ